MLTRREFLKVAGVGSLSVAAMAMAACGKSDEGTSNTGGATESAGTTGTTASTGGNVVSVENVTTITEESESALKEELTLVGSLGWPTLSPFQTATGHSSVGGRYLYDRLAFLDGNYQYVAQVAKSWEVEDDGVTWNVEIHDNVYDSDGNNITADDFVWFITKSMELALKQFFNKVQSVEKTGDYSFKIIMKADVVGALEMVLYSSYAVSRKAFEASKDEFVTEVVTSGPYAITDYVAQSHLHLTLKEDYWNAGAETSKYLANNVKNLKLQTINENSQVQIALETETVGAGKCAASLVSAFEGNDNFVVYQAPSSNGTQLYFSGHESRVVANDVNLRKAIAYCIDAQGMINAVLGGYGELMHDTCPRVNYGYEPAWDEEEYYPYDPELAKEYLAKSNYKNEELEIMTITNNQLLAQTLQGYINAIGINCKLNILDNALYSAYMADGEKYDMVAVGVGGVTMPTFWGNRYDCNAFPGGDATSRRDEVLTEMIYEAWTNAGFTKENKEKVRDYINDNCYAYGIYLPTVCNVVNNNIGLKEVAFSFIGEIDYAACIYE